ncbi:hypothetical protein Glove_168g26 [Diversispora epigaea]|uniref:Uncharacterized protein n=1 Tax=Diversispora epigaea TaxID=1348612 RepID=A0A397IQ03_9GLOM|nr:hypothetical protein Glove_168g26 [Diversispora epigaea]
MILNLTTTFRKYYKQLAKDFKELFKKKKETPLTQCESKIPSPLDDPTHPPPALVSNNLKFSSCIYGYRR